MMLGTAPDSNGMSTIDVLRAGSSVGGLSCCGVNVADPTDPVQNIAGGIRWLIKKGLDPNIANLQGKDANWLLAYSYYNGENGSIGELTGRLKQVLCEGTSPYNHNQSLFDPRQRSHTYGFCAQ